MAGHGRPAARRRREVGQRLRLRRRVRELDRARGARAHRPHPGVGTHSLRRGVGCAQLAGHVRGSWPARVLRAALPFRRSGLRRTAPHRDLPGDTAAGRPCDRHLGHRGTEAALAAAHAAHRRVGLPAVLGDRGRLRPRRGAYEGGARRRRMGAAGAQGVDLRGHGRDLGRRGMPHRPGRTQARRHHRLPGAHGRAGRDRTAHPADDRRRQLQRGLPRRRDRARHRPDRTGRRGLGGHAQCAGGRTARLGQPRPGQRRPGTRTGPEPVPPPHRRRTASGRRPLHPNPRPAAHRAAGDRRPRRGPGAGRGGVGGQAVRHRDHAAHQ